MKKDYYVEVADDPTQEFTIRRPGFKPATIIGSSFWHYHLTIKWSRLFVGISFDFREGGQPHNIPHVAIHLGPLSLNWYKI